LYSACLFFSLPRRHPRPTLFPYTTLFRSGPGKIGLPICTNLVKAGYRVLGYRRSPMTEFAQMGGTPAGSPAQVGAEADIVFACLPNDAALDEVVQGSRGLVHSARPGQIVIELGSHPIPVKQRYLAPLAEK